MDNSHSTSQENRLFSSQEINLLKRMLEKRIRYVGFFSVRNRKRKIPLDFDGLLNAVLGGAIPNLTSKFKNVDSKEKSLQVLLDYLLSRDISSSHFPTLLKSKEAPNYHTNDYDFLKDKIKAEILEWLFSFYYLDLRANKKRNIVCIRTNYQLILEALKDNFVIRGGEFHFELSKGRVETNVGNRVYPFFIPYYPSSTYFTLLSLLSGLFEVLKFEGGSPDILNLNIEILLLKNSGGNKWTVIYHPMVNIGQLYNIFFMREDDYTQNLEAKFWVFLRSLNPPNLTNKNIYDTYYSDLASFSFSLLVEGYLNVEKLSEIINHKISLEFRAKRENKAHKFGPILFVDYIQEKIIGSESMDEKLRKQMQAIAFRIGDLSNRGETQKSLLKRIIMDIKSEDTPTGFTSALLNYLPRLEREGIKISLPPQINTLPVREFLIIKNEFVANLWNRYIGGDA